MRRAKIVTAAEAAILRQAILASSKVVCDPGAMAAEIATLRARVAELEAALRIYACPDHWCSREIDGDHDDVLLYRQHERSVSGWIPATVALLGERYLQPQSAACEKALAALDLLTDQWAEHVGLLRIVGAVVHDPAKVEAMLRQSYAEGAYEGFLAGRRAVEE